eukprot:Gb_20332 [translate_table: standard]
MGTSQKSREPYVDPILVPSPVPIVSAKGDVMDPETAATFSSFGASLEEKSIIMKRGSDRFVPVLPSSLNMQSNQMLTSHSNQLRLVRNSGTPTQQAQLSREMYDVVSGQYSQMPVTKNSMCFASNLNAVESKTVVPTKRSGPMSVEKSYPHQDSVHSSSSASGSNAGAVSHSQSNSASDEAEDQHVIDERKQRRMLSNRESARRSRLRKQQHLDELRAQVAHLRAENGQILNKFNAASQHYAQIIEENGILKSQTLDLSHKLQRLNQAFSAQSHGVLRTMSIDNGNCTASPLSFGSGQIVQSLASSDLLLLRGTVKLSGWGLDPVKTSPAGKWLCTSYSARLMKSAAKSWRTMCGYCKTGGMLLREHIQIRLDTGNKRRVHETSSCIPRQWKGQVNLHLLEIKITWEFETYTKTSYLWT